MAVISKRIVSGPSNLLVPNLQLPGLEAAMKQAGKTVVTVEVARAHDLAVNFAISTWINQMQIALKRLETTP